MAKSLLMLLILFIQCVYITNSQMVPALYVFGDSTVDSGNNNNLKTKAKGDFLPYGIDFNNTPTPTGRFSNGLTSADFIATFLGLPYPPAYMNLTETEQRNITTGLNYASASCGILPKTGSRVGNCLSFDKQIKLFAKTIKINSAVKENVGKSIIYVSIGANDYTLNYLKISRSQSDTRNRPDSYAKFITNEFLRRLKRLYDLGARKFLVNGLAPIGCLPGVLFTIPHTGECNEHVNFNAMMYNDQLRSKLTYLQSKLPNSVISYSDYYKSYRRILDVPESYGINNVTNACWDPITKKVCSDRDKYLFFDSAHVTEIAQKIVTVLCFNHTTTCTPLNIVQLAKA